MKVTPHNVINHELVGLSAHVVESSDPSLVCRSGKILSESREMINLQTSSGPLSVPKQVCVFDVTLPEGAVVRIDGRILRGRPEDRMKKRLNRSW